MAQDVEPVPGRPTPWREVFQGRRGRLTIGLLLLEALVAMEALVVTTILPDVKDDLGNVQLYGWTFSAFALATFASIPIAGRAADRWGSTRPLTLMLVVYVTGLVVSALAPSMEIVVLGRFIQGSGAGALYSLSLGTVAKAYPKRMRPRVLALLASMWILPGLLGPPIGATIAATLGWRFAFIAPLPVLLIAAFLIFPGLASANLEPDDTVRLPIRWPLQLMVGAGMVLGGITYLSLWTGPLLVIGGAIGIPALLHIVPRGTLLARRGLPAAAAAAFLLSASFFAVDAFVPLMLTEIHGLSIGVAGIVITLATVTWSAGSFWQSKRATSMPLGTLVTVGTTLVLVGTIGVATGLITGFPVVVSYAGWALAGLGMGIAFPTIPLAVMNEAESGNEAGELSSTLLMDMLGVGIGAGVGGASIALLLSSSGEPTVAGLAGAFLIGAVMMLALLAIARRIPGAGQAAPSDA
ncbi:MAG: MFS transporter [Actinomycetota bacterium]